MEKVGKVIIDITEDDRFDIKLKGVTKKGAVTGLLSQLVEMTTLVEVAPDKKFGDFINSKKQIILNLKVTQDKGLEVSMETTGDFACKDLLGEIYLILDCFYEDDSSLFGQLEPTFKELKDAFEEFKNE